MEPASSFLRELEGLFDTLELQLEKQRRESPAPQAAADPAWPALAIRLQEAGRRLAGLAQRRAGQADACDPEAAAVHACADRLRQRLHRLLAMVEGNAAEWRQCRKACRDALQELHAGGQFLQSMRGYREHRPKCLDAHQ